MFPGEYTQDAVQDKVCRGVLSVQPSNMMHIILFEVMTSENRFFTFVFIDAYRSNRAPRLSIDSSGSSNRGMFFWQNALNTLPATTLNSIRSTPLSVLLLLRTSMSCAVNKWPDRLPVAVFLPYLATRLICPFLPDLSLSYKDSRSKHTLQYLLL
jgi:hypothetical protein